MQLSRRAIALALLALLALSIPLTASGAQANGGIAGPRRPRVGVVLSGGGAKGLAHIGVLRVLEAEGIVPEVVTGASMGALIGGLYAIGYSPGALDSLVTGLEWRTYFLDEPERRFVSLDQRYVGERTMLDLPLSDWKLTLPSGVVSGQRITEMLARLTWRVRDQRDFRRFPRAFAATATDIETGETVVLDSGSLAAALRASMSIPSLFAPARVNDRLLIDGGVTRNLPAQDARSLGAEVIICSDVSSPLYPAERMRSLVDIVMQTITIYMQTTTSVERELCDVYIRPDLSGLTAADFDQAARMIQRGVNAATAASTALRDVAERTSGASPIYLGALQGDSACVAALAIAGVDGVAARTVRHRLRLTVPGCVTADIVHEAVQRVHATELFDRVTYRLERRTSDTVLVVEAIPREQDRVGLGLRYDDAYDASLLFTIQLRNRLGFGSTTDFDLRLGEQLRIGVRHANVGFARSHLMLGGSLSYSRTPVPVFADARRVAETRIEVQNATMIGGVLLGEQAVLGLELKGERALASVPIVPRDSARRQTYATASAVLRWNSMDRPAFPTRGVLLSARSERSLDAEPFRHHVGSLVVAAPVTARLSLSGRLTIGRSSPESSIPLHYQFMLGGSYPAPLFSDTQISHVGLRSRHRSGSTVSRFGAAIQWEVRNEVFTTLRADIGQVGPALTLERGLYDSGVSIALGASTPLGPIEIALSGQPGGGRPRLEAALGYAF